MRSAHSTSCEKLSVSCAVKIGHYQIHRDFNELRNETVTVLEIGHYRERCNNGIILHDFVRFLVRLKDGVTFEIKAEKFNSGISVTRPPLLWNRDVEMKYLCENLEECGKIRMEDLLAILTEPSPDYNLMSDNCWSYADATFKQVLRKFSETPSLSPERFCYLASFLNNAPPVMPDKVLGSVISDVRTGVKVEKGLHGLHSTFIGVGTAGGAVGAHSTLATQVATFYTNLQCAGIPITPADVQNGLQAYTAAQAPGSQASQVMHAMQSQVPVHHGPLTLNGGVHTTLATHAVHAPLITHAVLHPVLWVASFVLPVGVAHFVWPVAVLVAGVVTVRCLWKVGTLVWNGTLPLQAFKKWRRSLSSRRPLKQAQGLPSM
ncbi:unnamed protein product [Sphagnum balticum]